MASGTVEKFDNTDGSTYVKYSNGIIIAFGTEQITTSAYSSNTPFIYRGTKTKSLSGYGFTSILAAFATPSWVSAAWSNGSATSIDNSNLSITLTLGQHDNQTQPVFWLAIGLWK